MVEIFAKNRIEFFGVAEAEKLLPLFSVSSKRKVSENAKSVITMLIPYYVGEFEKNIARYAFSNDYHTIGKNILFSVISELKARYGGYNFEGFIDSSPINEVKAAYLSGLGVIGKNGQLINSKYGSYTFIATIVTDMKMDISTPQNGQCKGCNACINNCPNGAIKNGWIDKDKCRSHITQKKGVLTDEETESIKQGGLVWGCDICTDCCVHNKNPIKTDIQEFYDNIGTIIDENNIDDFIKTKALGYRGKTVLVRNLDIIA